MITTWDHLNTHAPNELQLIPLEFVYPSEENVRLFIERQSLADLRAVYRAYNEGDDVVLPDAPILRFRGWEFFEHDDDGTRNPGWKHPKLEILAGERRCTAATLEEVTMLPCRVVTMTDEEAYRFILSHNDVAGLTTAELAYRAAEMDRLGFSNEEISTALKGASAGRYITVGQMIDPEWFTDEPKLCDPSIIQWFEAAQYGAKHFEECFTAWNAGLWNDKQCAQRFRRRGSALPLDNAERGFRITFDDNRLVVRGQVDLDITEEEVAEQMIKELRGYLKIARERAANGDFGARQVIFVNPTTIYAVEDLDDE